MAAPVNANINIVLNTKQATAQIRALQTEINSFNKSVVAANSAAARQQAALNKALIDSAMASGMFNAKIVPTTAGIHRFSEALDKGKLSLSEYTRGAASQLPGMRRIFITEFDMITKVAEDRVKRLQTQYTALGNAQKALALQPTALAMESMATQTALAAQKQMIFNKMISDGSTKLLNWGKNTQWAGRQLMVGFTLPLTMFGATAAKVFMDLDKQARDFKRVYGDLFTPPAEIESNLKAIQQLGDEYTKYGVKVSDTMQVAATAAAAGMKNEKLIAGTEESLRLATIGQIDYNQALDTTISLQTAFKMSADELAPSVDFLGAVANQTVLTIDDMTKAIPRVAPVVQGLGGDVKDLAAMLVAMREGGVSAENAANGLKSGLASLINPTNAAKEKLKELGINITAIVEANKGDLMGTVMDFGTALSKLGDFERQQALEKTFGKYQYARLGALFDNIIKKGGQAEVALTLAGKSAEELGQLSAKSLKEIEESTTAKFTGAVERLKVAIAPVGEAFLKALTPVIEFITKIADKFNSLPDGIKNAIVIVTAVVAGIGPVILMLVGLIANAGANIIKFIQMMRKGFARMRGDASAFEYLAGAELDAAAAAASLEGKTNRLTDAILIQENAVRTLIGLYEKLASSASAAARAMPTTMGGPIAGRRGGRGAAPMKMATGGVVPGSGSGDKIPALLEPGETVVTKKASQTFGPILSAMNSGTIPGFRGGKVSIGDKEYTDVQGVLEALGVPERQRGRQGFVLFAERILEREISMTADELAAFRREVEQARSTSQDIFKNAFETATGQHVTMRARGRQSMGARDPYIRQQSTQFQQSSMFDDEKQFIRDALGIGPDEMQKMFDIDASHIEKEVVNGIKQWRPENLFPDFKGVNRTLEDRMRSFNAAVEKSPQVLDDAVTLMKKRASEFLADMPDDEIRRELNRLREGIHPVTVNATRVAASLALVDEQLSREALQQGRDRTALGTVAATGRNAAFLRASMQYRLQNQEEYFAPGGRASIRYAQRAGTATALPQIDQAQRVLGINSPAKEGEKLSESIAQGQLVGAQKSSSISAEAGKIAAQSQAQAMTKEIYKARQSAQRREAYNIKEMQRIGMSDTQVLRQLRRLEESKLRIRQSEQKELTRTTELAQQNAKKAAQISTIMQQQSAAMNQQIASTAPSAAAGRGSRLGKFMGGRGGFGVGGALMSAAFMAPMLPGQAGEIGSQIQPAVMALSTLSMLGPLFSALANPVGLLVVGITAAVGSVLLVNKLGQDLANRGRELSDAMLGTSESLNNAAKYFNKQTYTQQLSEKRVEAATGTKISKQTNQEAQGFVSSEAGQQLLGDIKKARDLVGGSGAQKVLQNRLESMMLSGVIGPKLAYGIATEIGNQLGDTQFAVNTSAKIKEVIGYNGENLKDTDGRMQILADVIASATSLEDTFKNAGITWDGTNWFMQVVMQATGKGTSDIAAENVAGNIVNAQKIIGEQLAKNRLEFEKGTITAKEFYDTNIKILNAGKQAGSTYESALDALKKAYSDTNLTNEINTVNQQISDNFANTMTSALGPEWKKFVEESGKTLGNTLMNAVPQFGNGDLQQTGFELAQGLKINLFDAADIQRGIDYYQGRMLEVQGYLDKAKREGDDVSVAKYQEIIDELTKSQSDLKNIQIGQAKLQIAVESGILSPEALNNLLKGGQDYSELAYKLSIAPDQSAQLFYQLLEESGGQGIRADFAIKVLGMTPDQISKVGEDLFSITNLPPVLANPILVKWKDKSPEQIAEDLKIMRKGITKFQNMDTSKEVSVYWNNQSWAANFKQFTIDWDYIARLDPLQKSIYMNYIQNIVPPTDPQERILWEKWIMGGGIPGVGSTPSEGDGTTPQPVTEDNKGAGGEKQKSALQELMDSINERLKLYTKFDSLMKKFKGKKNAFEKAIAAAGMGGGGLADKLRSFNLNESLIAEILSKGAENAQKIINALEKRKGLAAKMNAKDILGRAAEKREGIISAGFQAMTQTKAATSARSLGASQEAIQKISEDYDLAYKFTKLPNKKKMQFILEVQKTIDAEKTLEYAQDPNKMLQDQIDLFRTAQDVATYANRKKIEGLQRELELVNRQISAIEELNEKDRQRIRGLERQKEMIQRQIDAYERQNEMDQRRIDALRRQDEVRNRVADALSHDLDTMSKQEQSIRDQYQERIDALNEINQLNDHIVESQKQQLGLSQALSQGDIYAAAAASQDMQASQGQYAREQQNVALQQGMENQVAGLTTPGGLTRQQAEEQINAIKEQSYQTSLQIRDIEDQIYNRNLLMVPLKDQQYQLDLQIRDINDVIFNRETEILNIQNTKLKPLQAQITAEQDILDAKNLVFETAVSELELRIKQNELLDKSIKNTNALATSWQAVKEQIAEANRILANQLQSAGAMPTVGQFTSAKEYQNAVNAYNAMLAGFKQARNDAVNAAMQHGIDAMKSMTLYAGGYVKGYATGNYVVGSGGRDSVPAMLTPGEFVVRKAMVDKMGVPALNRMNQGAISPGRMFAGGTPRFNESTGSYAIPKEFTPPKFTAPRFSIPENKMATGNIQKQAVQPSIPQYSSNTGYNNISVNVNVPQTNASPDTIANKVAMRIQDIHRRGIGNERVYKQ